MATVTVSNSADNDSILNIILDIETENFKQRKFSELETYTLSEILEQYKQLTFILNCLLGCSNDENIDFAKLLINQTLWRKIWSHEIKQLKMFPQDGLIHQGGSSNEPPIYDQSQSSKLNEPAALLRLELEDNQNRGTYLV